MIVNEGRPGGTKLPALTTPGAAADLLSGKQLINQNGEIVTGTMTNRGNISQSLNAGGSYTIPSGYHSGGGKVTANSLASQTSGTATAADIRSGKTAWVNGARLTGTGQMAGQRVQFGFLCHERTSDDIEVYTDVSCAEETNKYYDIPAGSTRAWTLECTLNSIIAVVMWDASDTVGIGSGFSRLETAVSREDNMRVSVFLCTSTNATLDVNR